MTKNDILQFDLQVFVGLSHTPFEEWSCVRPNRISNLSTAALSQFFSPTTYGGVDWAKEAANRARCRACGDKGNPEGLAPFRYGCGNHAGLHDCDPHIERFYFLGQALTQCFKRPFGGCIRFCRRNGHASHNRRYIDNAVINSVLAPRCRVPYAPRRRSYPPCRQPFAALPGSSREHGSST